MAQVIVQINGRNYTMQCDDGQEDHLRSLARMIDTEIANIRTAVGQLGDLRLLIMASLVVADRLSGAERKVAELEEQMRGLRAVSQQESGKVEAAAITTLEEAARRLEALADSTGPFAGKAGGQGGDQASGNG